jgi:DNA-binding MarR family transcriptional regulator
MTLKFKSFIEDLANQKAPGPSTTFSVSHVFFALELISRKAIGRNSLAKKLEVGEGAIRTIIKRLRDAGLITTSREGCGLTNKGAKVWAQFEEYFSKHVEIGKTDLTKADYNYAFLVNNSGQKIRSGIEQRDAAIMAGAKRAIIIVCKEGRLTIESVSTNLEKQFPEAANQILKAMQPKDNDALIIVGAGTLQKAKRGAFAASWTLVNQG